MHLNQCQRVFHALRAAGLSPYQAERAVRHADCNHYLLPPEDRNMVTRMVLWATMPGPMDDWVNADYRHYSKCLGRPLPPDHKL